MKRFTETGKWNDPWYRKLSSPAKQLWEYLRDHCDAAGVVEVDYSLVSSDCGQEIGERQVVELGERVEFAGPTKFFLPKFIHFQYGELNWSCPPHRGVLKLIEKHGLERVGLHYHYPNGRVALGISKGSTTLQEKEKEKEKEKEAKGSVTLLPSVFDDFWAVYPRHDAKKTAQTAWKKIKPTEIPTIMAAVERARQSPQWQETKFIPMATSWLNGRRWEDEPAKAIPSPRYRPGENQI